MGLVHAYCGRGSRMRRCHWLADFRGSGRGRDWCTDWLVRGDVVFWLVGALQLIRLQLRGAFNLFYTLFLAFVSRFAYKPLYSSQNHPLNCRQDRQSVTFTSEAGGRAGSPWDTAHTGAKGDPKGALNTGKDQTHTAQLNTQTTARVQRDRERGRGGGGRKEERADRDGVGAVSTLLFWSLWPFGVTPWRLERKSWLSMMGESLLRALSCQREKNQSSVRKSAGTTKHNFVLMILWPMEVCVCIQP